MQYASEVIMKRAYTVSLYNQQERLDKLYGHNRWKEIEANTENDNLEKENAEDNYINFLKELWSTLNIEQANIERFEDMKSIHPKFKRMRMLTSNDFFFLIRECLRNNCRGKFVTKAFSIDAGYDDNIYLNSNTILKNFFSLVSKHHLYFQEY